jgi:integrase
MTSKRIDWDKLNTLSRDLIDSPKDRNDFIFGLYIAIALRTGLRVNDILSLKKSNIDFETGILSVVTQKTKKPVEFQLPDWLQLHLFSNGEFKVYEDIFWNEKYKGIYSVTWINLRLKKYFGSAGVSSHSIRKSVGMKMYEHFGVNGARSMLTHTSLKHTSTYLELDAKEVLNIQKQVFLD